MIGRAVTAVSRVSLTPLLVRLAVGVVGLAALLVAVPGSVWAFPVAIVGLVVVAALPAFAPAEPWPALLVLTAAAGWVLGTDFAAPEIGRVIVLASLLYLLHTLAALADALPYDAVVAPDVLARWLARAAVVVAGAAVLTGVVLAGVPWLAALTGARGGVHAGATLAGLALAVAAAVLLRRLLRAPPFARRS